jgi:hypothetical protein
MYLEHRAVIGKNHAKVSAHPSGVLPEDSKALKRAEVSAHPSGLLPEDSKELKRAEVSAHPSGLLPEDSKELKRAAPAALAGGCSVARFVIARSEATWRSWAA